MGDQAEMRTQSLTDEYDIVMSEFLAEMGAQSMLPTKMPRELYEDALTEEIEALIAVLEEALAAYKEAYRARSLLEMLRSPYQGRARVRLRAEERAELERLEAAHRDKLHEAKSEAQKHEETLAALAFWIKLRNDLPSNIGVR